MIDKLKTLLKIKKLKEAEALKTMQMQRVKEREARSAADRSRIIVEENAATLEPRGDALYAEIIGKTIDLNCLDELKLRLIAMQKDHDRLKDKLERLRVQRVSPLGARQLDPGDLFRSFADRVEALSR